MLLQALNILVLIVWVAIIDKALHLSQLDASSFCLGVFIVHVRVLIVDWQIVLEN